jgi:esterase/lipase
VQHLILLHGAIGHSKQLNQLAAILSAQYTLHQFNFSGHGGAEFSLKGFSIQVFAEELLKYLDDNNIATANIFGYSMGGYVAMYLAKHYPGRIQKIITLATKFHWDELTAEKECKMLDAEKIEQKLPSFAQYLSQSHSPNDWKIVLKKTKDMLTEMGINNPLIIEDYPSIEMPVLLLLGDRDKMVTLDETVLVYKALPNAQMGIIPDTQHPIEQVDNHMLAYHINHFLAEAKSVT